MYSIWPRAKGAVCAIDPRLPIAQAANGLANGTSRFLHLKIMCENASMPAVG
jgi:hypothetical protein